MRTFITIIGMCVGFLLLFIGAAIGSMLGAGQFIVLMTGYYDVDIGQAFIGLFGGMMIALGGISLLLFSLKKATVLAKRIFFGTFLLAAGIFMMWMSVVYMPPFHPVTIILFLLGGMMAFVAISMMFFGSRERIESIGT